MCHHSKLLMSFYIRGVVTDALRQKHTAQFFFVNPRDVLPCNVVSAPQLVLESFTFMHG